MDIYHDNGWERDETPNCCFCDASHENFKKIQDYFRGLVQHLEGRADPEQMSFMDCMEELTYALDVEMDYFKIEARYNNANI